MTKNMIPQILTKPPEVSAQMILLNTLYYKGKWKESFDRNYTRLGTFNNADGTKSIVSYLFKPSTPNQPMMLRYEKDDRRGYQV